MADFTAQVMGVPRPNGANRVTNGDFESSTTGWESNSLGGTSGVATLTRSTAQKHSGTGSLLATWPTSASGSIVDYPVPLAGIPPWGLHSYTAWLYVPTGSPDVVLTIRNYYIPASGRRATSTPVTAKNVWAPAEVVFDYASTGDVTVCVETVGATTVGGQCFIDDVDLHEMAVPYLMLMADGADTTCPAAAAENVPMAFGARVQATDRSPQIPLVTSVLRYAS